MKRTFPPLVLLPTAALTLALATPLSAGTTPSRGASHDHSVSSSFRASGTVTDLQPDAENPTDSAQYTVDHRRNGSGTKTRLKVRGIDAPAGTTFGTHIHEGPCVEGDGSAAGPHWNAVGRSEVNDQVEVWLDFTINKRGAARAKSHIEYPLPQGEGLSVVIHELATDPSGAAGARLACFPLTP